jgi:hypothetical protein
LRERCRYEFNLDQEAVWRQVHQPILARYGELDRQVPVAENSARLKGPWSSPARGRRAGSAASPWR